tara:strand:- start:166 stop:708 length:543 start_codon:yes stop_codon:yes gene_type:complete
MVIILQLEIIQQLMVEVVELMVLRWPSLEVLVGAEAQRVATRTMPEPLGLRMKEMLVGMVMKTARVPPVARVEEETQRLELPECKTPPEVLVEPELQKVQHQFIIGQQKVERQRWILTVLIMFMLVGVVVQVVIRVVVLVEQEVEEMERPKLGGPRMLILVEVGVHLEVIIMLEPEDLEL